MRRASGSVRNASENAAWYLRAASREAVANKGGESVRLTRGPDSPVAARIPGDLGDDGALGSDGECLVGPGAPGRHGISALTLFQCP